MRAFSSHTHTHTLANTQTHSHSGIGSFMLWGDGCDYLLTQSCLVFLWQITHKLNATKCLHVSIRVSVCWRSCVCPCVCAGVRHATVWLKKKKRKKKILPVGPTGPFEHLKSSSLYCLHWIPRGATLESQSERIQSWHQGSCSQLWQEESFWVGRIRWQGSTFPSSDRLSWLSPAPWAALQLLQPPSCAKAVFTAGNKRISEPFGWMSYLYFFWINY